MPSLFYETALKLNNLAHPIVYLTLYTILDILFPYNVKSQLYSQFQALVLSTDFLIDGRRIRLFRGFQNYFWVIALW